MSVNSRLNENKAKAAIYLNAIVDGMESETSPLRYLKDNDDLVEYICYLSLPPWMQAECEKKDAVIKLPGGDY